MKSRRKLAAEYESMYPGTGVGEAQAAERMERIHIRERRGQRSSIVVPALPWVKSDRTGDER